MQNLAYQSTESTSGPNLTQPWIVSGPTWLHIQQTRPIGPPTFAAPSHAALHNSPAI